MGRVSLSGAEGDMEAVATGDAPSWRVASAVKSPSGYTSIGKNQGEPPGLSVTVAFADVMAMVVPSRSFGM